MYVVKWIDKDLSFKFEIIWTRISKVIDIPDCVC